MNVTEFNSFLLDNKLTIATAESITAGLLSSTITSVAGASAVFKGGVSTYTQQSKMAVLGVRKDTLKKHSAESLQTTIEMVEGLSKLGFDASIYVAITGIASQPVTDYKIKGEVGQIYVSVLYNGILFNFQEVLISDSEMDTRNQIREKAVAFIFEKIVTIVQNFK